MDRAGQPHQRQTRPGGTAEYDVLVPIPAELLRRLRATLEPCECEKPGYFCSGVPGIIAHVENGRLAQGAKVERCDLCQRYPSDQAALKKLQELGIAPAPDTDPNQGKNE